MERSWYRGRVDVNSIFFVFSQRWSQISGPHEMLHQREYEAISTCGRHWACPSPSHRDRGSHDAQGNTHRTQYVQCPPTSWFLGEPWCKLYTVIVESLIFFHGFLVIILSIGLWSFTIHYREVKRKTLTCLCTILCWSEVTITWLSHDHYNYHMITLTPLYIYM